MVGSRPAARHLPMNNDTPSRVERLEAYVWDARPQPSTPWQARGLRIARTMLVLGQDVARGQLTLRAMSLVYTTLLSIVPMLALSFSVLKAFGVSNEVQPALLRFVGPLGDNGVEVANRIVQFIENMNVGVLGAVGLATLLYTAVSLVQKIEESLNFIWHVPQIRPLGERFSRYLSVLMVGPILVFAAIGITASVLNVEVVRSLMSINVFGMAVQVVSRLMPYALIIGAFTFVYIFIPNTRVRPTAALIGGVVGGIGWQTAGWAFATFVATSNNYSAIYSGLAIMVLFMIWIYLSWVILLFGASVAFYVQHPEYLSSQGSEPVLSNRLREQLALSIASLAAGRFLNGERGPSLDEYTQRLHVPGRTLAEIVGALEARGLLVQSAERPAAYLPARDPDMITVQQLLDAVRAAGEDRLLSPDHLPTPAPVVAVLGRMRQAVENSVGRVTLRELASPTLPEVADRADRPAPIPIPIPPATPTPTTAKATMGASPVQAAGRPGS